MLVSKSYKFRLYPNKEQIQKMDQTFGAVRFVWNNWVEMFNNRDIAKKEYQTTTALRVSNEWMTNSSAAALQQKFRDFLEFKSQFFNKARKKRLGRPNFKSKKNPKQSFRLPNQKFKLDKEVSKIKLERIGTVKVKLDREIPKGAKFTNVTVSKNGKGEYYVSISVKENHVPYLHTNLSVGVDVGLKDLATLSSGLKIKNPKYFTENQGKLRKLQRSMSRKRNAGLKNNATDPSKRYIKVRQQFSNLNLKLTRQRSWYLHNVSTYIVKNFSVIGIEDLKIAKMIKKKKRLAKAMHDASLSMLLRQIEYKSNWNERALHKVDTFYPSSKTCSTCGSIYKDLKLSDRIWVCPVCGGQHDRDYNASLNIENQALRVIGATKRHGENIRPGVIIHPAVLTEVLKFL